MAGGRGLPLCEMCPTNATDQSLTLEVCRRRNAGCGWWPLPKGSPARQLAQLCCQHLSFRRLRGGVSLNYHSLADFRVQHPDRLEQLLQQRLTALLAEGLVSLDETAQDGMRVRARAASGSFRRQASLHQAHAAA